MQDEATTVIHTVLPGTLAVEKQDLPQTLVQPAALTSRSVLYQHVLT